MTKIYWYRTLSGKLLDESEDSAWRVHNQYVGRMMGHTFLGWSEGKHLKKEYAKLEQKRGANGFLKDHTKATKIKIHEAIALELKDAALHKEPPVSQARKFMAPGQGGPGQVGVITNPAMLGRLPR